MESGELPYMDMEELAALLGYKNPRAARAAIKRGTFEIQTYILANRRVANVSAVKKFFASKDPVATEEENFLDD